MITVLVALLALQPEGAMGTYPLPGIVGMRGHVEGGADVAPSSLRDPPMSIRVAPWPLNPLGDVVSLLRYIVWEFEGASRGHCVVDNPKDGGGRTLSGLTWRTYSLDFLRLPALCPVAQFDALTLDDVVGVMVELFAMRTGLWKITDPALRFVVIDYCLHAGADDAVPALQRALGVEADGDFGRHSHARLEAHPSPRRLVAAVMDERYRKAGRQCLKTPSQLTFLNGWLSRFGQVLRLCAG